MKNDFSCSPGGPNIRHLKGSAGLFSFLKERGHLPKVKTMFSYFQPRSSSSINTPTGEYNEA